MSQIKFTPITTSTTTTSTTSKQSSSQTQSTLTQSPTSIQLTTKPTTTTSEITTTATTNVTPTTTVISTTIAEVFTSNSYAFGIYEVSWAHGVNYVDFEFTVKVPDNSLTNFWAAFAFSTDDQMVSRNCPLGSLGFESFDRLFKIF